MSYLIDTNIIIYSLKGDSVVQENFLKNEKFLSKNIVKLPKQVNINHIVIFPLLGTFKSIVFI